MMKGTGTLPDKSKNCSSDLPCHSHRLRCCSHCHSHHLLHAQYFTLTPLTPRQLYTHTAYSTIYTATASGCGTSAIKKLFERIRCESPESSSLSANCPPGHQTAMQNSAERYLTDHAGALRHGRAKGQAQRAMRACECLEDCFVWLTQHSSASDFCDYHAWLDWAVGEGDCCHASTKPIRDW